MYTGLVNFGLQIGGPVLAACVCNWLTVLRVRRSGRELRSQHGQGHRARRCAEQRSGQATRTVLMLTNLYIACQLPQLAWGVIALTNLTPGVYIALTLVSNAVGSLDGSCNFFIYVASNNRFKTCLAQMLPSCLAGCYGNEAESSAQQMRRIENQHQHQQLLEPQQKQQEQ
uniref:G_PROTEIN_RECEP_F1_2 domain-containing protein n=1 Tax=Macrostomum lignano TaxID=282301 RepID=A0A1I8G6F6_9PLAT